VIRTGGAPALSSHDKLAIILDLERAV